MAGFTQLTDEQENQLLNSSAVSSPPQIEEEDKDDDDVQTGFTQLNEEQAIALSDGPPPRTKAEIVTTKQRLAQQTEDAFPSAEKKVPISTQPVSMKSLIEDEQFIEDILQYRKDRFGVEKDVGGANLVFGYMFGEQEQTPENIVDDYMDHYRFVTGNSLDAAMEVGWLESLTERENEITAQIDANPDADNRELIDEVNNIAEQKARALRLYQRADSVAGLFNSKRYEDMNALEMIGDISDTIGGNVLAGLSDPMTALTAGVGRFFGGVASSAGLSPLRSAIIAAATTAPIEAGGAAVTDIAVQTAELEMGAREEIDYKRTAIVAGTAATLSGTLAGLGTANTAKRVDKATRGELSDALKNVQKEQTKLAEETNKRLGFQSLEIREQLAKGIEDTYGKEAILRRKDGTVKGLNNKFLRESEDAKKFAEKIKLDEELYQPALSFSTFERVTASVGEIIEGLRKGDIKLDPNKLEGPSVDALTSKLQKDERVSERLLNILNSTADESFDATTAILGKYGVTQREIAATMFADASRAGKTLRELRTLSDIVGRATRNKTAEQIGEEAEDLAVKNIGRSFRRLEDLRRLTLVSGLGTAVRNNFSQYIRSGVDTLVYGFETGLHSVAGTGRKKFGLRSTIAQLEHTFYDQKDAATIAQFMLDLSPKQKERFFNQYSEVTNTVNKRNPGQAAVSGQGGGLQSQTPILDKWESAVNFANGLNRYQEAIYRNGMFTASIQRQLFDKVATEADVDILARSLAQSNAISSAKKQGLPVELGTIKPSIETVNAIKANMKTKAGSSIDMMEVIRSGRMSEFISEDMTAKAVDDALDFTYANQPEWSFFRNMNNLIVNSGATLIIPFPRFMFKAMEMTYNYNVTGVIHGLQKIARMKLKGQDAPDREIRRIAEGIAGGIPLMALGYTLRDPDGQTAGSEWYMLKDGKGNEFDARPFFPLTPYLLFGEIIHRFSNDKFAGKTVNMKELTEGLTGANFRGTGAASRIVEDFFAVGTDDNTELEFRQTAKELGTYFGEALSGYGQPIYQLADILYVDNYQRMRDYKTDLDSGEEGGYVRALESFFSGVFEPFKSRLGRVADAMNNITEGYAGYNIEIFDQSDVPFRADPRSDKVPERVLPFMKIMFGATLNRVPPAYIQDLSRMGFKYTDFMARTNSEEVDRFINRQMGILMNREMPEAIATAKEIKPDDGAGQAMLIKAYISDMKSALYAQAKLGDDKVAEQAMLQRFLRLSPFTRRSVVADFKKENKKEPDLKDLETLSTLLDASKGAKFLAEQRPN